MPPEPGTAIPIAPGVLWLRMPLPFALDHINLWLLENGDGWTLVDTGYASETTRALWARHFEATLKERPVTRVIATHCHPDHVGNADWITQRFACPLAMTQAEFLTAHAISDERAGHDVGHTIALFRSHGLDAEHAAGLEKRGNQYRRGVPSLPRTFERLIAGDAVRIGEREWRIIEGHGHSPEHASLWNAAERVLISGDMLLPRISTNISVWAVEPEGDPLHRFLESLSEFEALPPGTLVLPSHGLPFRGIPLRVADLRAHHAARLQELEDVVRQHGGVCAADLVPLLFRRELDLHQRFFAMGEAIAHLNYLWHAGRLQRTMQPGQPFRFLPH